MQSSWTAVVVLAVIWTVQCQESEPSLRIMAKSSVFNINETRGIFCKGKNVQEPVEWYDPAGNKVEERSSGNRIYVEWKNESDSIVRPLILSNMVLTDSGNWTCKSGDISETKEIIVGEKCKIADSDVTEEGEEDKSIRFSCKAKGHPPPVFTWAKEVLNDEGKKERATIKATNKKYVMRADHSLEIKKLNHADVGVYFCKATQKALSHFAEKTIHLTVRHKPVLYNPETLTYYTDTYKTEELFTVLNVTKYINCTAIANPPPTYRWFRRINDFDEPILDPDVIQTSEDGVSSVLLLRVYNQSDLGEYKCTANNTRGSESIIFHVRMGNKPSVPDSVSFISSNTTTMTFKVTCPSCIYDVGGPVDPSNLTITGFDIRIVRYKENYEPDWDEAELFEFEATNANDTIFDVGPVANSTKYYAQVRSRNAAGGSDWLNVPPKQGEEFIYTTDGAIKARATLLLVIAAIVSMYFN